MKIRYVLFCYLFIHVFSSADGSQNEFVQPKKQRKRISIDALKKSNIEACSDAFESSAALVEGLGKFQKNLKQCIDGVLGEGMRTYHEQTDQCLTQVTNLLHQMEDLLVECEKCLHN